MSVVCPSCRKEIAPDDVNVAADVAFCRNCNSPAKLSAIAETLDARREEIRARITGDSGEELSLAAVPAKVDLAAPPAGCWYRDDGVEARIGASMRSVAGAMAMLFFTLFWNGIVSIFVLVNTASTLHHMGINVPSWFPAPTAQSSTPLGMTLFMWVFLTPFLLVGAVTAATTLATMFGHTEVRIRDAEGSVFVGVGPLGWRRRFDAAGVKAVHIGQTTWRQNNQTKPVIVLEGSKTVRFGSMLSSDRREFVAGALRTVMGV